MNKIDLHMHSQYSLDGEKSVKELIAIAKQNAIEVIAIADHNSTQAYQDITGNEEVRIIPAIELDCSFQDRDFHLLGYFIDPFHPIWNKIHTCVDEMEKRSGMERLQYIQNEMGIKINHEKLKQLCPNGIYEAESVCEVALSEEENRNNPYLKEFYPGGKHGVSPLVDFFWEYCAKGKIAYSEMKFMPMEEAIRIYREQNAFIVLAHPGNNVKEEDSLLEDIIALGIDGLEVYSSYHSDAQIQYYAAAAKKHNLIMSSGSDYHGKTKPNVIMGECRMPKQEEEKLLHFINNYTK